MFSLVSERASERARETDRQRERERERARERERERERESALLSCEKYLRSTGGINFNFLPRLDVHNRCLISVEDYEL